LIKIETYESTHTRKGWTKKTFLTLENGEKVLTEYDFNSKHNTASPFKKQIENRYYKNGNLKYKMIETFWKDKQWAYYSNGQLEYTIKGNELFNRLITKEYSETGELINKEKEKCRVKIVSPVFSK